MATTPRSDGKARTAAATPPPPPLRQSSEIGRGRLFLAFLRLGSTSFGGGTAGWLYRDIVLKRRWIDDEVFLALLTIGQALPGANGIKMTVLIGQRLHGAAGAAIALFGMLAGPFAIVLAIGAVYGRFGGQPLMQHMLDGVAAAVIGLTFATGLRSMARGAPGATAVAMAAATVVCVGVLGWPMLPVIAVLAPISIGLALLDARRRRHG